MELPDVARHVVEEKAHAPQKFDLRRQVQPHLRSLQTALEVTVPTAA